MLFFHWFLQRMGGGAGDCEGRNKLRAAGLDEQTLRRMDPDDRVAALENAGLDPYDFIFLAY